jgi:hypothetical protein
MVLQFNIPVVRYHNVSLEGTKHITTGQENFVFTGNVYAREPLHELVY